MTRIRARLAAAAAVAAVAGGFALSAQPLHALAAPGGLVTTASGPAAASTACPAIVVTPCSLPAAAASAANTLGSLLAPPAARGSATTAQAPHAFAATSFVVTTASDPASTACPAAGGLQCSLRAAINAANALGSSGNAAITFAVPGPFVLASQSPLTSALVVDGGETLSITGAPDGSTVVDANHLDRAFLVDLGTTLTIENVVIKNGHALFNLQPQNSFDGFGGGIGVNSGGHVTLLSDTVTNNEADNGGGGIDVNSGSTLLADDTTFSGNIADGSITGQGGALDVNTGSTASVINSTLTGNTGGGAGGGGISAVSSGAVQVVNATISGNHANGGGADGGGVLVLGSLTVTNSIVSGNDIINGSNTGTNCAGTVTDGGHNLEQGTTCGFATNAVNADPKLGALAANGGFAPTMALDPGSPAINAGDNTVCAAAIDIATPGAGGTDERGANRPQATHCDIGAFEVIATTTALVAAADPTFGTTVTLTATVTAAQNIPGPPNGVVSFFNAGVLIGSANTVNGVATLQTDALPVAANQLTATFAQTPLFLGSVSGPVTVTVTPLVPDTGAAARPGAGMAVALLLGGVLLVSAALVLAPRRIRGR